MKGRHFEYFLDEEVKVSPQNEISNNKVEDGNTVKEISYESNDNEGNKYIINADSGTFKDDNKDEIFMTNVKATIKFNDGNNVFLSSKFAKYNTLNNDTNFYDDVNLKYLDHKIKSDNIDVFFKDSYISAYNNLIYNNLDVNLIADKVEMDLLTKNSKIFMFDKSKVKIIKD